MSMQEGSFKLLLNEYMRQRCERLLSQALETELEVWLAQYHHLKDGQGRQRVVRNGYIPERPVRTLVGEVRVSTPRSRDRNQGSTDTVLQFKSSLLPVYLRNLNSAGQIMNELFLKGLAVGDLSVVLSRILGRHAIGLNDEILTRLRYLWREEWFSLHNSDLSKKQYKQIKTEVVLRSESATEGDGCYLVVLGIAESGRIDLLSLAGITQPTELLWVGIARRLRQRGLNTGAETAIAGGATELARAFIAESRAGYYYQQDRTDSWQSLGFS